MMDIFPSALTPAFVVEHSWLSDEYPHASPGKLAALALYEASDVTDDSTVATYLRNHGVHVATAYALAGPICLHRVKFGWRNIFSFDVDGEPALVSIVPDVDGESEIDLLAWSATDPLKFGTFLGVAGLLGADHVINPSSYFQGAPLRCHRTPLGWLQSGCNGIVVLSAAKARPLLARRLGPILAEDKRHAEAIVRRCAPALSATDIFVDTDTGRAAA